MCQTECNKSHKLWWEKERWKRSRCECELDVMDFFKQWKWIWVRDNNKEFAIKIEYNGILFYHELGLDFIVATNL